MRPEHTTCDSYCLGLLLLYRLPIQTLDCSVTLKLSYNMGWVRFSIFTFRNFNLGLPKKAIRMSLQDKWTARLGNVARHCWDLGFTSFGGPNVRIISKWANAPQVHFAILHRRFVQKLKWIDEQLVFFFLYTFF